MEQPSYTVFPGFDKMSGDAVHPTICSRRIPSKIVKRIPPSHIVAGREPFFRNQVTHPYPGRLFNNQRYKPSLA